ncbi:unnamed protein product [Meloidogyne enterolobii]|uniref:Uncharacterized protein n=1 Tax=Meloidogyne enterolobii TaxID=390850 RepID=A0ACB1ADF1_MELEN
MVLDESRKSYSRSMLADAPRLSYPNPVLPVSSNSLVNRSEPSGVRFGLKPNSLNERHGPQR